MSKLILDEIEALTGDVIELKDVCVGVDPTSDTHVTTRGYENTQRTATNSTTDTTNFNRNLSSSETNTQLALDKLDDLIVLPTFSSGNSVAAVAQVLTPGDSYNLLTSLLEANEDQRSNETIVYKDISDVIQATFLDETNNKFLFPSNQNTFNLTYVPYLIRTVLTVDYAATTNSTTKSFIRLRRVVDDSIIAESAFIQSDFAAETGIVLTSIIQTFVEGEADPFVDDGAYIDIINDTNSTGNITVDDVSIRIFRG